MIKTRPQCGLIFEDKKGRILLQLRDDKPTIPYPNRWGTFGGQIEKGETPTKAIKREIKEELNYNLVNPVYFGNFPFDGHDIHMFMKVSRNITLKDLEVREGQKGEFLSLKKLKSLKYAFNCKEIVQEYIRRFLKQST